MACTGRDITMGDGVISPPALALGLLRRGAAPAPPGARTAVCTGGDITAGHGVISPPALAVGLLRRGSGRDCACAGGGADCGVHGR